MKLLSMLLLLCIALQAKAQSAPPLAASLPPGVEPAPFMVPAAQAPPIEKLSPGIYRIGDIVIDRKERCVTFPAQMNTPVGALEYLLVRTGGKTHEALLTTKVEPYDLQVALLLLGFEGGTRRISRQGADEVPTGDSVTISLSYRDGKGVPVTVPPEFFVIKKIDKVGAAVENINFLYTGSFINEGRFMAQTEGSMIALYHDPAAMLDHASSGGESDEIWFANENTVPVTGTQVTVTIKGRN